MADKVLVIADIHGNAAALEAVMARDGDADACVFLGDAVLSGPQPRETIELMARLPPGPRVLGNHDLALLEPARMARWPAPWRTLNHWIIDRVGAAGREFIGRMGTAEHYVCGGAPAYLTHGEGTGAVRAALPDSPDAVFLQFVTGDEGALVLFGHSHVQFRRTVAGREFINPGSVGQNRCGRALACYGVFENGTFCHRQVAYDSTPWFHALDGIGVLDPHPDFRQELARRQLSGFGVGRREPWLGLAARGYC